MIGFFQHLFFSQKKRKIEKNMNGAQENLTFAASFIRPELSVEERAQVVQGVLEKLKLLGFLWFLCRLSMVLLGFCRVFWVFAFSLTWTCFFFFLASALANL